MESATRKLSSDSLPNQDLFFSKNAFNKEDTNKEGTSVEKEKLKTVASQAINQIGKEVKEKATPSTKSRFYRTQSYHPTLKQPEEDGKEFSSLRSFASYGKHPENEKKISLGIFKKKTSNEEQWPPKGTTLVKNPLQNALNKKNSSEINGKYPLDTRKSRSLEEVKKSHSNITTVTTQPVVTKQSIFDRKSQSSVPHQKSPWVEMPRTVLEVRYPAKLHLVDFKGEKLLTFEKSAINPEWIQAFKAEATENEMRELLTHLLQICVDEQSPITAGLILTLCTENFSPVPELMDFADDKLAILSKVLESQKGPCKQSIPFFTLVLGEKASDFWCKMIEIEVSQTNILFVNREASTTSYICVFYHELLLQSMFISHIQPILERDLIPSHKILERKKSLSLDSEDYKTLEKNVRRLELLSVTILKTLQKYLIENELPIELKKIYSTLMKEIDKTAPSQRDNREGTHFILNTFFLRFLCQEIAKLQNWLDPDWMKAAALRKKKSHNKAEESDLDITQRRAVTLAKLLLSYVNDQEPNDARLLPSYTTLKTKYREFYPSLIILLTKNLEHEVKKSL